MKHQSMAVETRRELERLNISRYGNDLAAEPAMTINDSWTNLLVPSVRVKSHARLHLHSQRASRNVGWFVGLYITSLLSVSGVISGVRWMLTLL
jgi:hypothetical protein